MPSACVICASVMPTTGSRKRSASVISSGVLLRVRRAAMLLRSAASVWPLASVSVSVLPLSLGQLLSW